MNKKPIALVLIGVALTVVTAWLVSLHHAAKKISWGTQAPIKADQIASFIEIYKLEEGQYPTSVSDLVANTNFSSRSDVIDLFSSYTNTFRYDCRFSSNGFVITVSDPTHDSENLLVEYKYGELLKRNFGK
jgi:hypothetical protein